MSSIIPYRKIYQKFLPYVDFKDKTILDIGGNAGNLLHSSAGNIKEENYTCVDVNTEALELGKLKFPKANWIYYNLYNERYNKNGIKDLDFPEIEKKDLSFAITVTMHNTIYENIRLIKYGIENCKQSFFITFRTIECYPIFFKRISSIDRKNVINDGHTVTKHGTSLFTHEYIEQMLLSYNLHYIGSTYNAEEIYKYEK